MSHQQSGHSISTAARETSGQQHWQSHFFLSNYPGWDKAAEASLQECLTVMDDPNPATVNLTETGLLTINMGIDAVNKETAMSQLSDKVLGALGRSGVKGNVALEGGALVSDAQLAHDQLGNPAVNLDSSEYRLSEQQGMIFHRKQTAARRQLKEAA